MKKTVIAATAAAVASLCANAQAPATDELPLATAMAWAQGAIAACDDMGYKVSALYMSNDLAIKVVLRADGAGAMTADVARRKAYTVLKTGMTSDAYGKSVLPAGAQPPAPRPGALPGLPPGDNVDQNLIVWGGGIPVKKAGKVVGAVSVSGAPGGHLDTACVEAGLGKIAGQLG